MLIWAGEKGGGYVSCIGSYWCHLMWTSCVMCAGAGGRLRAIGWELFIKILVVHVTQETEGNDCTCFGTAKIANGESMLPTASFQQQQMEPEYNFWGCTNCQRFRSLTYPAKWLKSRRGHSPGIKCQVWPILRCLEVGICELGLYSVLDDVRVIFGFLILIPDVFQWK